MNKPVTATTNMPPGTPTSTSGGAPQESTKARAQASTNLNPADPRFMVLAGRSKNGKSFTGKYLVETARADGRNPLVCDCDRDNPSLTRHFGKDTVRRPKGATSTYFVDFLKEVVKESAASRRDVFVDIGFGLNFEFRAFCQSQHLSEVLVDYGIRSVLISPIGPNVDDLAPLASLLTVFKPDHFLLLLNQALCRDDSEFETEFRAFLAVPEALELIKEHKPCLLHLPRMPGGAKFFNREAPFADVASPAWDNPLDMFERRGAADFLQKMNGLRAQFAAFLP